MNLLGVLKRKYDNVIRQRDVELRKRRQLNMSIDVRLVGLLKRLAAEFTVPRDIVGEHVLETGCYYLTRAMENEEMVKIQACILRSAVARRNSLRVRYFLGGT